MAARYSLDGKVCLITGSARGIGYATAKELHARGAYVVLTDLDEEAVTRAAKSIGERAMGFAADVTDSDAMEGVVSKSVESFDRLDVLIANAGVAPPGAAMRHIDPNLFERTVEIDLLGVWRSVRPALPQIVENRGHVVVVSSVYAWVNGMFAAPYAASKAGVEALGRALRSELSVTRRLGERGPLRVHRHRDGAPGLRHRRPAHRAFRRDLPGVHAQAPAAERGRAGVVDGIEKRAPRIIVPRWWGVWFALRGILNPIFDRAMERQEQYLIAAARRRPRERGAVGQKGLTTPATADDVAEQPQAR